jgi:hypothetical protein
MKRKKTVTDNVFLSLLYSSRELCSGVGPETEIPGERKERSLGSDYS